MSKKDTQKDHELESIIFAELQKHDHIILPPGQNGFLKGTPNAQYELLAFNESSQLNAYATAYNSRTPLNFNGGGEIDPNGHKIVEFQMNPRGTISVSNFTSKNRYPNPLIKFLLIQLS